MPMLPPPPQLRRMSSGTPPSNPVPPHVAPPMTPPLSPGNGHPASGSRPMLGGPGPAFPPPAFPPPRFDMPDEQNAPPPAVAPVTPAAPPPKRPPSPTGAAAAKVQRFLEALPQEITRKKLEGPTGDIIPVEKRIQQATLRPAPLKRPPAPAKRPTPPEIATRNLVLTGREQAESPRFAFGLQAKRAKKQKAVDLTKKPAEPTKVQVPEEYARLMGSMDQRFLQVLQKESDWKPEWNKPKKPEHPRKRKLIKPKKTGPKKKKGKMWIPKPGSGNQTWRNGRKMERKRRRSDSPDPDEDYFHSVLIKRMNNNAYVRAAARQYFSKYGEIVEINWKQTTFEQARVRITFKKKRSMEKVLDERPHTIAGMQVDLASDAPRTRRIYIENVTYDDEDDLYENFRDFGKIKSLNIVNDKKFGVLEFKKLSSTISALKKDMTIRGRKINIALAMK